MAENYFHLLRTSFTASLMVWRCSRVYVSSSVCCTLAAGTGIVLSFVAASAFLAILRLSFINLYLTAILSSRESGIQRRQSQNCCLLHNMAICCWHIFSTAVCLHGQQYSDQREQDLYRDECKEFRKWCLYRYHYLRISRIRLHQLQDCFNSRNERE